MSIIYAPYAAQAGDSGVLSNSAMSTPHCALKETYVLRSSTIARIVFAKADKSEYAVDLATRRLWGNADVSATPYIYENYFVCHSPYPFAQA